jgi:hypothetical protein
MEKPDPRPLLLRRVIIDMLPYSASNEEILTLQDRLGLVPSSLDVLELERKESNTRIATMQPLSEAIGTMSGYSAEAIAEYFLMQIDHVVDDEGDETPIDFIRNTLVNQNVQVISTAVHGILSHLVASGILVLAKDVK